MFDKEVDNKLNLGTYRSWTVLDESRALKKIDNSFINGKETGIPVKVRGFFKAGDIDYKKEKQILFHYNNIRHKAVIKRDATASGRVKLSWYQSFADSVSEEDMRIDNYMMLIKRNDEEYDVLFERTEDREDNLTSEVIVGIEGKKKEVYTIKYERDPKLRDQAIKIHGAKCAVCGFDFKEEYGKLGENYIEVHHIEPLSTYEGTGREVNPENDLVCVCSNCHRMLHRFKHTVLTIDALKNIREQQKNMKTD